MGRSRSDVCGLSARLPWRGRSEREVTRVSIPNIGPEHPDSSGSEVTEFARRGNPALLFRDEPAINEVVAAEARASTVTHRFGGVRYALSRPGGWTAAKPPAEEGESDASE
jgi:hypothetical protein